MVRLSMLAGLILSACATTQLFARSNHHRWATSRTGTETSMPAVSSGQFECLYTVREADVLDAAGTHIGSVENILLRNGEDRVAFVVCKFGGISELKDRYLPLPLNVLTVKPKDNDKEKRVVIVNLDRERLIGAPYLRDTKWNTLDLAWAHSVWSYFRGVGSAATGSAARSYGEHMEHGAVAEGMRSAGMSTATRDYAAFIPVTSVIGLDVKNFKDEDLGKINTVIADVRTGQLAYAVLGTGGFLGIGEKMSLVPWPALDVSLGRDIARVDADQTLLREFAFSKSELPNLSDRSFAERIFSRFGERPYWENFGFVGEGANRYNAWKLDSQYLKRFNTGSIETIEGTVLSVGSFWPEAGAAPGLRLHVRANDGRILTVQAGPRAYALRQDIRFMHGDKVKITGCEATIDNQKVIIASEIQWGDKTLRLLQDGKPAWNVDELTGTGMAGSMTGMGQPQHEQHR